MDSDFTFRSCGVHYARVRMANKKNKKEIKIKWFPGYDFHLTVIIIIGFVALGILKACK